jgi:type IV pilus assembly protein PilQ
MVFNGQTTVIGGLSKEQVEEGDQGIPWLKDIPFLGYLFKGESTKNSMEELLIFITPHILGTRQDAEMEDATLESD